MKDLPHWSHVKFLTPEWMRMCVTKLGFVENLKDKSAFIFCFFIKSAGYLLPFVTLITGIFVLHVIWQMTPTVYVQSALLPKGFTARLTNVRSFLAVNGLVSVENFLVVEILATIFATVQKINIQNSIENFRTSIFKFQHSKLLRRRNLSSFFTLNYRQNTRRVT